MQLMHRADNPGGLREPSHCCAFGESAVKVLKEPTNALAEAYQFRTSMIYGYLPHVTRKQHLISSNKLRAHYANIIAIGDWVSFIVNAC